MLRTRVIQQRRIAVALSGGVDSSVAAHLLQQSQPTAVLQGVHIKCWNHEDSGSACSYEEDLKDAQSAADRLKIPLSIVDLTAEYWHTVWTPSLATWQGGHTPNPDVLCNSEIKFRALLCVLAERFGTRELATVLWPIVHK